MNTLEIALKLKHEALSHGCTSPKLHVLHGGPHHIALDDGMFGDGEFEEVIPFTNTKLDPLFLSCRSKDGGTDLFFSINPNTSSVSCETSAPIKHEQPIVEPIAEKIHDMFVNGPRPTNPESRKPLHVYRFSFYEDNTYSEFLVVATSMSSALEEALGLSKKGQTIDSVKHVGEVLILSTK